ncbi:MULTISPECIES: phage late control D family protein [Ureibacillus]|uniref:Uncharacterized protein n=1 Tax=Ureibacillus thermosphaericus TaxID=51173 RepID=A0A840PV97_URETH|nr:contractile injection system protein, VgrG/Pvc8 family [Ureibacillus thermosphaericus]MBB5148661.1 hypothetical protein [Ureibacillus thermosphaericus]NKZ31377.1 hypothetical protein [Ureibacillus thermosphaericus]
MNQSTDIGRRTSLFIEYNHQDITAELKNFITGWTYTDNLSGEIDNLEITLQDRDALWLNDWFPRKGSIIKPTLYKTRWNREELKTKIGEFEIDEITGNGPPSRIVIKALSITEANSLRGQQKSRAWEKATLKTVASDIAKANGMKLYYQSSEVIKKDRWEQEGETDLSYLYSICKDAGLCLKLANKTIVILDEADYEAKPPVATIIRHSKSTDPIKVINYAFKTSLFDTYAACKVKYRNSRKNRTYSATFTPPNVPNNIGRILYINEEVSSNEEAYRLAKKRLREKNKNATTITLTVTSLIHIDAGMTFNLIGFGRINGKYIATKVIHRESNITLHLRRCLEGY